MLSFSKEQLEAIKDLGKNTLVSAGAGSGKTAVLTERIYQLVKSGASLSKFLVLTFTNLASGVMKSRVRAKILDDPSLASKVGEVDVAHIETFDAFSLFLVKKYFYKLGVSKDISVLDNSIFQIKEKQILDEILLEMYQKEEPTFINFVKTHCIKNDDAIVEFILNFTQKANSKNNVDLYLDSFINRYFNHDHVSKCINEYFYYAKSVLNEIRDGAYKLESLKDSANIINFIEPLLAAKNYDEYYALKLANKSLPNKVDSKNCTDGEYRDYLRSLYTEKLSPNSKVDFGDSKTIESLYLENKDFFKLIVNIVKELNRQMLIFKKEHASYSFSDIARMANSLLDDPDIQKEMSESFDYIMIDEYQDTSDIQEAVINKLARNNAYMVGDVKQSIYRFRNANCSLFQDKYNTYSSSDDGEAKRIDLNMSFRSRKEVVNFVNETFSTLMDKKYNPIDYLDGHNFGYGFTKYNDLVDPRSNYNTEVLTYSGERKLHPFDESSIIINDIINKINNKFQVYDPRLDKLRDATFKDFAIIMDRGTNFDIYRRAFAEAKIPLQVHEDEKVTESEITFVIKNLLKILKYALLNDYENVDFVHSFVSVSRSFLFAFSDQEIYELVKNKTFLVNELGRKMELIKEKLRSASLKEIMITFIEEFDFYQKIITLGDFENNTNKVILFITLAESFDSLGYSLDDFVSYFDELNEYEIELKFADPHNDVDAVQLLNIHKSKGLEYCIIYYPGLYSPFNQQNIKSSYLVSDTYGPVASSYGENTYASLFNSLIKREEKQADFEEKLRLFYVAITRAREKLIFLLPIEEKEKHVFSLPDATSFKAFLNYLDIINKYGKDANRKASILNKPMKSIEPQSINVAKINLNSQEIIKQKASKEIDETTSSDALLFGTRIHRYLEVVDLSTRDLSFIKDEKERQYVYNVINSSLFKDVTNEEVRREYAFFDEDNNLNGVIDALIIKADEIIIVDYKLKNISEEEYDKQLLSYKTYLTKKTAKAIKCFLISAINGDIREVK